MSFGPKHNISNDLYFYRPTGLIAKDEQGDAEQQCQHKKHGRLTGMENYPRMWSAVNTRAYLPTLYARKQEGVIGAQKIITHNR